MLKKCNITIFILTLSLLLFSGHNLTYAEDDDKAVMETVSQFYTALNNMFKGDLELMKEVWSHANDITYMGPGGGIKVGWDQVLAEWESQAAMKLGGTVKPQDMRLIVGKQLAVTSNYEIGENMKADGEPVEVKIRATNVLRKVEGKWKIIGHHTDLLPFLKK